MYRPDGSFDSNNNIQATSYGEQARDFGIHKAIVTRVYYGDSALNSSANDSSVSTKVLYTVQVLGGPRDGQLFSKAEDMCGFGGLGNYTERIWKAVTTLPRVDLGDLIANLEPLNILNGDQVYIAFVNGDVNFPIIVGGAKHSANQAEAATSVDGPRLLSQFNGIKTLIDKDGKYSFSKANGAYTPVPAPNPAGSPPLIQDQFLPILEDAVKVDLGNSFDLTLSMQTGLEVRIDGNPTGSISVKLPSGLQMLLDGSTADSLSVTTLSGASFKLEGGTTDKLSLGLASGTSLTIDGVAGSLTFTTTSGDSLGFSQQDGLKISTIAGANAEVSQGKVALNSAGQAALELTATGGIKLGNPSGDVLAVLESLIQSLTTATYAGFGAPGSNVADLVQLLATIKLVRGA